MTRTAAGDGSESVGYQTRAVTRALALLDEFDFEVPVLSVGELHRRLSIPKSTVVRLAAMLERHGYLSGSGDGYSIGPKAFELGALYTNQHGLGDLVEPVLEQTRDRLEQTVCLGILANAEILHLAVIRSRTPVHYVTEVGTRAPAHSTGLGKALLAQLDDDAIDAALGKPPYRRLTTHTLTTRSDLFAELRRTRRRGYALDNEESALGLKCVATHCCAPMIGEFAISVSGATPYFTRDAVNGMAAALREAGSTLARLLTPAMTAQHDGAGTDSA